MEGSNLFRVRSALGHMILRPKDAGRWLLDNIVLRKTAIERGLPWMSWKAIDFLQGHITPGLRVFEWGGGGSTIFFADRGCHVTTVESSEFWKQVIQNRYRATERSGSLEIRFIPAETRDPRAVTDYIQSIDDGAPWDIIVIDGLEEAYISRIDCIRHISGAVRKGSIAVLDDSYRSGYKDAPNILQGWERRVFRGLGSGRLGVTQTDVYYAPQ
jgi:hypothetical protein